MALNREIYTKILFGSISLIVELIGCSVFGVAQTPIIDTGIERTDSIVELLIVDSDADSNSPINIAMVEKAPEFPGGELAMRKWLAENISIPEICFIARVKGAVEASFVIENDGRIGEVKITKPLHPTIDREFVTVLRKMPKWTPGSNNGKPVKVTYIVPMNIDCSKH